MLDNIMISMTKVLSVMPYFGALMVLLFAAKFGYRKMSKFEFDYELTENDNPAFGVALCGLVLGTAIALMGLDSDWLTILIFGPIAVILVGVSILINDKAILYKFSVQKEIADDKNSGTGFVIMGSCVATGFVINGALSGTSESLLLGVRDIIVYWIIGQGLLIGGGQAFQAITKYDVHHIIEENDNTSAGLAFGGFLVSIGIIMQASLRGAGSEIMTEAVTTVVLATVGMGVLAIVSIVLDKALLPSASLTKEVAGDGNLAAGALAATSFVSVSSVFSAVM